MNPDSAVECWGCGRMLTAPTPDEHGYVKCAQCGLRFYPDGTAPRDQYNSEYFANYGGVDYQATEDVRRYEARKRLELVRAHSPGAHDLLDIGSAAGFFLDEAQKAGFRPVGVEPVESVAEYSRTEFGVEVIVGWAEEIEFAPASFDVACMWHSLEHIPAPSGVLKAVHAALRPGGKLLIEIPNAVSLLAKSRGDRWFNFEAHVHVGQWTPAAIGAALERTGFSVKSIYSVPALVYWPSWEGRQARRVMHVIRQRRILAESHPTAHDLLRAVAVA